MIHFSYVACNDCGERHTPGNPTECVAVLLARIASVDVQNAALTKVAEAARVYTEHGGLDDFQDIQKALADLRRAG